MIDCRVYYDDLLEAAPDELAGVAPTGLGEHVRDCVHCGETARLLLAEQARLGSALAALQPRMSAEDAADDVLATLDANAPRYSRRARVQRWAATIFPMAAAAGLAMYAIYGRPEPRPPVVVDSGLRAARQQVRITVPAGAHAVVLKTSDRNITFAWIGPESIP